MVQTKMLNYLLGTTSKVEILRVLYESDDAMTGRRIAAIAGISPRSCQLSLDSLVKNKALFRKAVGRAYSYTINRDHKVIWDLLEPVFEKERALNKDINQLFVKAMKPKQAAVKSAFLTISHARTGETAKFVVVANLKKAEEKELSEILENALNLNYGFAVQGMVVSEADFKAKVVGSDAAKRRFDLEYEKVKGATLVDLVGEFKASGKKGKGRRKKA